MPETSLFLNADDERMLVELIFDAGGKMASDRHRIPEINFIADMNEYLQARESDRFFFVVFESFEKCPLRLRLLEKGYYAGTYFVEQRTGGPTIEWLPSIEFFENGVKLVSGASFGYHSSFENTLTNEMEEAPLDLVATYKSIAKQVKKSCKMVKGESGRKYYIGPATFREIKAKRLRINTKGLHVD